MDTTDNTAKPRRDVSTDGDQPIRFAGSVLGAQRHVCAFFHSTDEEHQVLLPFIGHGFECGVTEPSMSSIPSVAVGFAVDVFASAEEFLASDHLRDTTA
ncbi:MAG TPA: hypothetical protein VFU31_03135 [Candidatus Binatia bacterium]|nr:hypothetical protein [Candidatus Binatia bacterium]